MKEVKRPVVSVVVPVYNTEPFLAECLHSLEKQTLTDIEIILVNDGSTDNSGRLLREYAGKDARFVYVEQENQGLSAARNTGMEHASGHYLAFLDSDDWLAENALQVLCAIAAKTRTDIVSGNTLAVHADGQVQSWERRGRELFATGTVVSGSTYFSRVMDCRCYVPMVYNYLYRRDFIEQNGFRFEPGLVHEDELLSFSIALRRSTEVLAFTCDCADLPIFKFIPEPLKSYVSLLACWDWVYINCL